MSRALLALNALLLAASAYLGTRVFDLWMAPFPRDAATPSSSAGAPAALAAASVPAPARTPDGTGRSRTSGPAYATIADKNLFSPTRTETGPPPVIVIPVPAVVAPPVPPPPPPPPKPFLTGVVILESGAIAYMEDPSTKRIAAYRVGDALAGGTIVSIASDHVVLDRPSGKVEVRLRDPAKPRQVVTPQAPGQSRREPGAVPTPQVQPVPGATPGMPGTTPRPFPPNLLRRVPAPPSGDAPTP